MKMMKVKVTKDHTWTRTLRAAALTVLVGTLLSTTAFAQRPGPPPGGPFGSPGSPFGGPGGPFGGPGREMRGPRPSSLADTPLAALAAGLKLTAAQKSKITTIQSTYREQRQHWMPRPGDGPPPPREAMRGMMDKMRGLDQATNTEIKAVLTDTQKAALPTLLKTFDDLRFAGIPLETYGALNLRAAQKAQIASFVQAGQQSLRTTMDHARQSGDFGAIREAMQTSRDQVRQKTDSVLTPTQKTLIAHYKASHPRPDRGFGPPPPGGGFGPPPPDRP